MRTPRLGSVLGPALGLALTGSLLLPSPVMATRDPPAYRDALAADAAARAQALNAIGRHDEALDLARAHQRAFGPSAALLYEIAFAYNMQGELDQALRAYGEAIELAPDDASARYDRAEILLGRGDLDAAEADLAVVLAQRADHWAVHLRLAEVAGRRGQPQPFEEHLLGALRVGMDWGMLANDPVWYELAADERVGPVLKRLITVYGDTQLWERLSTGTAPTP